MKEGRKEWKKEQKKALIEISHCSTYIFSIKKLKNWNTIIYHLQKNNP
jgi:hypothetical protein